MRTAISAIKFLRPRERFLLGLLFIVRLTLTAMDLLGIALIGLAASLLTSGKGVQAGLAGIVLATASKYGFGNTYAFVGALAILFFVLKAIASMFLNQLVMSFTARLENALAVEILDGLIETGLPSLDMWSEKQITHGVGSSSNTAFGQSLTVLSVIFGEAALLIAVSTYLMLTDIGLFATMAAVFGVFGFTLNRVISAKASTLGQLVTEKSIVNLENVDDALKLLRVAHDYSVRNFFVEKFRHHRLIQAQASGRVTLLGYAPRYAFETMMMICFGALLFQRSIDGGSLVSASTLSVFIAGAFRIVGSMLPLQGSLANLKIIDVDARNAISMLRFVRSRGAIGKVLSATDSGSQPGSISVTDVTFTYPGHNEPTLSLANITVGPGEAVGIVGKSGSGKSSFADLLLGLREPDAGEIFITSRGPGAPIVGYVPQQTHLVHGSFLENCFLKQSVSSDEVEKCLMLADALDLSKLISQLPHGIYTPIGDAGTPLSGGQVQRIGLIRALLLEPDVLILDEITSALDESTAAVVTSFLGQLKGTTTMILIAHRKEALKFADCIYELKNGNFHVISS